MPEPGRVLGTGDSAEIFVHLTQKTYEEMTRLAGRGDLKAIRFLGMTLCIREWVPEGQVVTSTYELPESDVDLAEFLEGGWIR